MQNSQAGADNPTHPPTPLPADSLREEVPMAGPFPDMHLLVPVNDVSGVDEFGGFQELIQDVTLVNVFQ